MGLGGEPGPGVDCLPGLRESRPHGCLGHGQGSAPEHQVEDRVQERPRAGSQAVEHWCLSVAAWSESSQPRPVSWPC